MSFGSRLKEARIQQKMSRADLARAVGVTQSAIGNYELEISSPKENILIQLMHVLGIDANYLYQDVVPLRVSEELTKEELNMVFAFRAADDRARADALSILQRHSAAE